MSTGKPEAHTCGKMTPCDRCNEEVAKGKAKMKSGFTSRPIFCVQCTSDIVVQSRADIAEIEAVVSQYL